MELFDLYDINRKPLGQTMVRGGKQPPNTYRLVVHVCIFNSQGQMLCQHRQIFKSGWSNMWDITVGGHVVAGEMSQQGARREAKEELGVTLPEDMQISLTVPFERGFDDYYCIVADLDAESCTLQHEEVSEVAWLSQQQICQMIDDGSFIPYHKGLIQFLFHLGSNKGVHTRKDTK